MRSIIIAAVALAFCSPALAFNPQPDPPGRVARDAHTVNVIPAIYRLDATGKCHDAKGKFAKQSLCAKTIPPIFKLDAKGKCHGSNGKFVTASMCKSVHPA